MESILPEGLMYSKLIHPGYALMACTKCLHIDEAVKNKIFAVARK